MAKKTLGRIRVMASLQREELIATLPKAFWVRLIPRFKPLNVCLLAVDGTSAQAAKMKTELDSIGIPALSVTFSPFEGEPELG